MTENFFCNLKLRLYTFIHQYRYVFLSTVLIGLIVYYQMYSTGAGYADPFPNMERYYVSSWADQLGRWMLPWLDDIQGGMVSPFLNTLLSLVLYGIGNMTLCRLFRFDHWFLQIIVSLLIVASPNTAISLNNYYMSEAYPLAYLFAVLSVLCVHEQVCSRKHCTLICSIACLFISLGMYQSYLGVAFALIVMVIIADTLRHRLHQNQAVQYLITAVISPIVYFLTTKLVLYFSHTQMADLHGASSIGFGSILTNLPHSIMQCYKDFFAYFFQQSDLSQNSFHIIPLYILCFITVFAVFLYFLIKDRKLNIATKLLLCLGMAVLPVMANVVDLITSDSSMYLTSIGGMLVILPVGICLLLKHVHLIPHSFLLKTATAVLSVLVAYCCILQDNADISVMEHNQNQAVKLSERIWSRIEQQYPDDLSDATICVIGIPSQNPEFKPSSMYYSNANWYARIGMFWNDWNGSSSSWHALFQHKLGLNNTYCSHDDFVSIVQSDTYRNMSIYPAADSIQKINGIITVKIAPDESTEDWY